MLKRLINFITFVDLPIRKKFTLFSLGVLFWFVAMFSISIAVNLNITDKTDGIVSRIIPHDRAVQKITRKIQGLNIDAIEITTIHDAKTLEQKIDTVRTRLSDIRASISALTEGGLIHDINRNTNQVIESFIVSPLTETDNDGKYAVELLPLVNAMDAHLKEIADIKT
ncbi:MAG: hypothetical protein AB1499_17600, partial [Nitrospirota bacterium]